MRATLRNLASRQEGLSLIELIISMAITSIVLSVLTGVVFGAYQINRTWGQRIYESGAEALLPNALQADAHQFSVCPGSADSYRLPMCLPGTSALVATYSTDPGCAGSCDLLRTRADGSATVVARGLTQRPQFSTSCAAGSASVAGTLTVTGLAFPPGTGGGAIPAPQPPLVVYFQAPIGGCGQ